MGLIVVETYLIFELLKYSKSVWFSVQEMQALYILGVLFSASAGYVYGKKVVDYVFVLYIQFDQ